MRFSVNTQAHHFTQAGVVIILRKILLALTLEICMMRDVKFHFVETATQSLHNVTYDMNKSRANDGDKQAQIETMCRRDITSSDTTIDLCEFAKSYLQSNYKVWMVPVSILFLFFIFYLRRNYRNFEIFKYIDCKCSSQGTLLISGFHKICSTNRCQHFGSTVYKIFALKCQKKLHTPLASLAPCVINVNKYFISLRFHSVLIYNRICNF